MTALSTRGRRGHGEQTREEIIAAAEALLLRHASEEEVSVRAVAEAVGVTPPAIYRHFPDKAHLLFEVCSRQFDRLTGEIEASVRAGDDPLTTLAALARAYARFGIKNPEHYRIMFMGRAADTPALWGDDWVIESGSFAVVLGAVRDAIDAGALRSELDDPLDVATTLWAGMHGVVALAVAKPDLPGRPIDERVDAMVEVLLRGIRSDDASSTPSRPGAADT